MNLITDRPSRAEIRALLREPSRPPILPAASSPAWGKIFGRAELAGLLETLVARARREAREEFPALPDELYREFHQKGTRDGFQGPYFERRRRLGRAMIAALAGPAAERPAFLRSFLAQLDAVAAEKSWALPAHVKDASGLDPLCIDLASAQTACLMAETLVVFGEVIPEPGRSRLRARLGREFFENYLARADSFFWTSSTGNWNAVCHQGVVGAALAADGDLDRLARLLEAAGPRLGRFLDGFTEDGGCTEGPDYWSYGFGNFCALNELMEMRTGGALSLFNDDAKVARIAAYGPATSLAGGWIVNFSDAKNIPLSDWLLGYLGLRLDDESCRQQAVENFRRLRAGPSPAADLDAFNADFSHWQRVFRHSIADDDQPATATTPDAFFPELGVWVARGRDESGAFWELAAKGGHNGEHHNHNDLGSFILNIDGEPLITEIGSPEYTKAYFQEETRYSFLATRSLGHSLPVINGREQAAGAEFRAEITLAETAGARACFVVELAGAYPREAGVKRFTRSLALDKAAGEFVWEDRIELREAGTVESALISDAPRVERVSETEALIERGGVALRLRAGNGAGWVRVERHDYRDHFFKPASLSRLVLKTRGAKTRHVFEVAITRAAEKRGVRRDGGDAG